MSSIPKQIAEPANLCETTAKAIFPQAFLTAHPSEAAAATYLRDPSIQKLVQFFGAKGLAALKDEDQREKWYDDWLAYQAQHHLYADLLAPRQYSTRGGELNLLRLTRFFEVFGYCSPSHGYSFQVTFLGLFSILMGANSAVKTEAVAKLERGGLLAFGISEKRHGSDLLANEFVIKEDPPGQFMANGVKNYIGNSNCASMISILARLEQPQTAGRARRPTLALFVLRPEESTGFRDLRKIRTLGVRAAFVGEFSVKDHRLPRTDVIAEGRKAWDAVLGTVALGKFFLGFGQIGICEHAFEEAAVYLRGRILYGNPAVQMTHLKSGMAEAHARLTTMKLYAYRALDYVQTSSAADRRYLLFTAVQKAKVGTEGVKVMGLLSACTGAFGFKSETYLEMAIRDAQLIPILEGSAHINLDMAAQFLPAYFGHFDSGAAVPGSMFAGQIAAAENPYLMEAVTNHLNNIRFPRFSKAYRPLRSIPNVRTFARQSAGFGLFIRRARIKRVRLADPETTIALGNCLATITYAQLIAENCLMLNVPPPMISRIFHILVQDLSISALNVATLPALDDADRMRIRRLIVVPETRGADWDFEADQASNA
jgi:acyl-CoA dehydrogenase